MKYSVEGIILRKKYEQDMEFLFFWGHNIYSNGAAGKQILSQWFRAPFIVAGIEYPTAEHYMMASKARLFNDTESLGKILSSKDPAQARHYGRV